MIEALIDGERPAGALAELAKGKMRAKIPDLTLALEGPFGAHHALMCRLHLDHIDRLEATLTALDRQVEEMMQPFRAQQRLLMSVPGFGALSAAKVISEIGVQVGEYFCAAAHLASWAGLYPGNRELGEDHFTNCRDTERETARLIANSRPWATRSPCNRPRPDLHHLTAPRARAHQPGGLLSSASCGPFTY
ncbi:transposase [Spirillospora sp. CA-255316]